jgi:bifunctional DNA-binding transcriptional regulator/antitoxin component of YhaV-PrlF toxin-antitoxin module
LKESSGANNWHAAQKKLRERFQARNGNTLVIVRRGEVINFGQSTDFFLVRSSPKTGPSEERENPAKWAA